MLRIVVEDTNYSIYGIDAIINQLVNILDDIDKVSDKELERAVSLLGRLNVQAFKGYRGLTGNQERINDKIYEFKNNALIVLAMEFCIRNKDVAIPRGENIIYFRYDNGVQVSFHIRYSQKKYFNFVPDKNVKWDMVKNSFLYNDDNIQEYYDIRNQYELAEQIINDTLEELKDKDIYSYEKWKIINNKFKENGIDYYKCDNGKIKINE